MARNRMLNPEFWLDEDIAKLSAHARLLYMGLWGICDDNYATFPNRPEWIKAQVFPYDDVNIRELLSELLGIGKIILFTYEDSQYFYIKNFFKHQRVERPSKAKYPEYKPENKVLGEPSVSPRSEVKLSKEKLSKEKDMSATADAFNLFWEKYPRKELKRKSQEVWKRKNLDTYVVEIIKFIDLAVLSDRWKKGFIKQPPAFLTGECWNDDVESYNDRNYKVKGISV